MPLIFIRKSLAFEEQAHVEIKFIAWTIILIEIPGDGRIIDPLGKKNIDGFILAVEPMTGAVFRVPKNRTVKQPDRPVRQPVLILIREDERHFPVIAQVADAEGRSMHL